MGSTLSRPAPRYTRDNVCFCPTTNYEDINSDNICALCGKVSVVINMDRFSLVPCSCTSPPQENMFYFCLRCRGVILDSQGKMYPETVTQVTRYFRLVSETTIPQ